MLLHIADVHAEGLGGREQLGGALPRRHSQRGLLFGRLDRDAGIEPVLRVAQGGAWSKPRLVQHERLGHLQRG